MEIPYYWICLGHPLKVQVYTMSDEPLQSHLAYEGRVTWPLGDLIGHRNRWLPKGGNGEMNRSNKRKRRLYMYRTS